MVDERVAANPFFNQSLTSVKEVDNNNEVLLSRENIFFLFQISLFMKQAVEAHNQLDLLRGHMIAVLFYQPSSRTYSSHVAAANWLGAMTVDLPAMNAFSSVTKGENLPDTVRSFEQTTAASAIVLRHPDDASSKIAKKFASVPIINAGSGTSEHPTQALLDLFTIYERKGSFDNQTVAFVGDLKFGRTVKSLAWLLAQVGKGNKLAFVAHPELQIPEDYLNSLPEEVSVEMHDSIEEVLKTADVIYMTRTQREWFEQHGMLDQLEQLDGTLRMTREYAERMKDDAIILHPLPRQTELRYGVDDNPRAAYFEQMRNGLYVRMALLAAIIRPDLTVAMLEGLVNGKS